MKPVVASVLKSGGPYDEKYVERLYNGVKRNTTIDFEFICLTDINLSVCETIELEYPELNGWWAKLELFDKFRECPVVFFDLDTLIINNIDNIFDNCEEDKLCMLHPLRARAKFAAISGIMAWQGDLSYIFDVGMEEKVWEQYRGDQEYIQIVSPHYNYIGGVNVKSYKWDYNINKTEQKRQRILRDTDILCFHGKPRPHELNEDDPLILEYWK